MATISELQEDLAAARAARRRILAAQEIAGGGGSNRRVRYADLEQVNALIKDLEAQIASAQPASSGYRRVYRGVPGC